MPESEPVVIKNIGNEKVMLIETVRSQCNWLFIVPIIVGFVIGVYTASFFYSSPTILNRISCGCIFSLFGFIFGIFEIGVKNVPAYKIYSTVSCSGIVIGKTNPQSDQIAICKAAKEMELGIERHLQEIEKYKREKDDKKRELEEIVGRCK